MDNNNKLQVTFGVNGHGSRAINRETSLPDGSQVGARLSGYAGYENLVYTASTGKTPQTWTGDKDVVLSDVSGTLYAFYPYDEDIDIAAIPVDMSAADQTDWLYGVPATGITDLNPEVDVTMNHALANINLSIVRDTYAGTGAITSISVQSDGIASKGTFNAAQATPGYTAFTVKGEALERSVSTTLGAAATDIMVIPTGAEAAITFFVTVDDVLYTVKSAPLTLEMGNSYQYTLKLNSTFMSVDGVSVTPWNNVPKEDDLVLEEYDEFDAGIIATYYVDEASFASRSAGVEMTILGTLTNVDRMKVDGVEVTPSLTYTFTLAGKHTVKYLLKDNKGVPNNMFNNCNRMTGITVPETVTSIGEWAFQGCSGLTSITIPNSVKTIEQFAFAYSGLISVAIPNSVKTIGDLAFYCCNELTSIDLGQGVTTIGDYAFHGCRGLTSITIPNSMTEIGDWVFYNCTGLENVTIPNSVTTIGSSAFNGCKKLTNITIPNSVTTIGGSTFVGCKGLTSITIPNSVTEIGERAFQGCSGMESIVVDEGNTVYDSRNNCNAIMETATNTLVAGCNNTVIPDDCQVIGGYTFVGCEKITNIVIPESVTSIGEWAFSECAGLNKITSLATTAPSIQSYTFNGVKSGGILYVPENATGYDAWMQNTNGYLGYKGWTMKTNYFNGVYIMTAAGELVDKSTIDNTALGVVLITDNQRILISKADATDGTNYTFQWCSSFYDKDVAGITEATNSSVAKADFNGKDNTLAIIAAYSEYNVDMGSCDMCKVLATYTEGGFNDLYVPACGQLYEMRNNSTDINVALANIGGTALESVTYWSSSEYDAGLAWSVNFGYMGVESGNKLGTRRVRFVRNIE